MAIYRRKFDFKTLFNARIVGVLLPLFVTVPIAFFTHSYWALIIGTICGNLSNAIILTIKSTWKPKLFFKVKILKEMLSFSVWSLLEAISIWLTNYIGVFIIGNILSTYYLGIYKTSMSTVNQFITIITSSTTPVLFSTLSRLQDDKEEFENMFLKFQRLTSYLVVPLGIGLFLYRDLVTDILLGSQWKEATGFVGLWALISCVKIIYSNYCYEVYRSLGKPKIAVIAQLCQLVVLVPSIYFTAKIGFKPLYIARSLITLELIVVNQILMKIICNFSILKMLKNTYFSYISSIIMAILAIFMQYLSSNILWSFFSIILCAAVYFISLYYLFPKQREEINSILHMIINIINKKIRRKKLSESRNIE